MTALEKVLSSFCSDVSVIAIDGRAAAGKTTLAAALASALGGSVIHMDDFFLPPSLRTEARYGEPGGNVHYERFMEEVLPSLRTSRSFSYRRFDCSTSSFLPEPVFIDGGGIVIVEGAYSLSPRFGRYYGFSVFCDIEREEQMRRIKARNGVVQAEAFRDRWIPLEERYIKAFSVDRAANLCICCQDG